MESKKIDRRILKTKKAIKNALIDLIAVKDLNEITIKEIADKADIDRKTLYNYYSGIYDVLDEITDELVHSFDDVLKTLNYDNFIKNPYHIFETLNHVINENYDLYKTIIKMNANNDLKERLYNALKIRLKDALMNSPLKKSNKLDLIINFITSGMITTYHDWFTNQSKSLEELSLEVGTLIFYGVNGLLKDKTK